MTEIDKMVNFQHFGDVPEISDEKIEEFIKSDRHSQYLLDSGTADQILI